MAATCPSMFWRHNSEDMQELQGHLQSHIDLEGIIDCPLGGCQGSNHDNAQAQASGGQLPPTHVTHHAANGSLLKQKVETNHKGQLTKDGQVMVPYWVAINICSGCKEGRKHA